MEKRWWLWEWKDGSLEVRDTGVPCPNPPWEITEVRLVPVEKENPMDDGLVTLRVAPDSLEAAIAGTRRGQKWAVKARPHLQLRRLQGGCIQEVNVDGGDGDNDHAMAILEPSGWHRVEEPPLKCPACGDTNCGFLFDQKWQVRCYECGCRGPLVTTEPEAREAFRRMGGKR